MTYEEFVERTLELMPNAELYEDVGGQIVVLTGVKRATDLVELDTDLPAVLFHQKG